LRLFQIGAPISIRLYGDVWRNQTLYSNGDAKSRRNLRRRKLRLLQETNECTILAIGL